MTAILTANGPVLSRSTGVGVRIAIVDSGVARTHPHVGTILSGVSLIGDDPDDWADRIGHGTAVAAAVQEKAPDAELIAVRVLDRSLATSARVLARAIQWAVDAGVHLVNLSLGTTNATHTALFEEVLRHASNHGVLVVSAARHLETPWYPGDLPGAIGVIADADVPRDGLRVRRHAVDTLFEASPFPRPIEGIPVERNLSGVSFAVANVTGLLALALNAGAPSSSVQAAVSWIEQRQRGQERTD